MRSLEGLTIIMMGASGGIGTATAMQIAKPGVNFAICSVDEKGLAELKKKIGDKGANVYGKYVDVTKPDQIKAFMDEAFAEFGSADILINFAGLSVTANIDTFTEEQYDLVMDVNLKGMVFSTKYFAEHVDDDNGALVISFGSMASKRPNPKAPHYSAAKAAVNMFADSLAQQLKARNIRFTQINPGPTNTTFFEGRIPPEKRGSFMQATDVAELLEFVMTRDSRINYHDVMFDCFDYFKK